MNPHCIGDRLVSPNKITPERKPTVSLSVDIMGPSILSAILLHEKKVNLLCARQLTRLMKDVIPSNDSLFSRCTGMANGKN